MQLFCVKSANCDLYHYRHKNDTMQMLFDGEIISSNESEEIFMATSSITANFAIRDEKEAKASISAFLSDSRSTVPPVRKLTCLIYAILRIVAF